MFFKGKDWVHVMQILFNVYLIIGAIFGLLIWFAATFGHEENDYILNGFDDEGFRKICFNLNALSATKLLGVMLVFGLFLWPALFAMPGSIFNKMLDKIARF